MLVLRGTQKLLQLLPPTADQSDLSDTALGDWYVNRIVIDRRPLLLCVSSKSLLSVIAPARDGYFGAAITPFGQKGQYKQEARVDVGRGISSGIEKFPCRFPVFREFPGDDPC